MPVRAILFGSIGALTETSELQREAYNAAFREAGLDWEWSRARYAELLLRPGGANRIAREAEERGQEVDAANVHRLKSLHFQDRMQQLGLTPRPGVASVIEASRASNARLGFCTTTSRQNVERMLEALAPDVEAGDFAFVGSRDQVQRAKPAPEVYERGLFALGVDATDVIAIEDTPESAAAPIAAGIATIGFPGEYHVGRPFPAGVQVVEALSPGLLGLPLAA